MTDMFAAAVGMASLGAVGVGALTGTYRAGVWR